MTNKNRYLTAVFCLLSSVFFLLCSQAWSATYYVKQTAAGGDTGADCANAKSLGWFNGYAVAGDTAILCDGTYTQDMIDPTNSGSVGGGYITYQVDSGATVVIDGNDPLYDDGSPIDLRDGQDYIKVIGPMSIIHADNTGDALIYIDGCNNIVIDNITASLGNSVAKYTLIPIENSQSVEILNCDISGDQTRDIQHDLIRTNNTQHLFVYNTELHEVTHDAFGPTGGDTTSSQIVFKDCLIDNKWRTGITKHNAVGQFLVEGCTFENIGNDADNNPYLSDAGNPGSSLRGGGNDGNPTIWRFNTIDNCPIGMMVYGSVANDPERYHYLYHNTTYGTWDTGNSWYSGQSLLFLVDTQTDPQTLNRVINNIFSEGGPDPAADYMIVGNSSAMSDNVVEHNIFYDAVTPQVRWDRIINTVAWQDANSTDGWDGNISLDPKMVDPGAATPDFTLQQGSPAIDAGRYLTKVNNANGTGTSFVVDDAGFFFSEETWDMPDTTGVLNSDTIYVKALTPFTVKITGVNYSTKTLTWVGDQTWEDNAEIYLCPDGVCFSGSAPDIGANEYGGPEQNTAPYGTYNPGGDITIYHDVADTITANSTIVDDEGDTISYLWTLPNSDKDGSTLEDPGTVTFTWVSADTYSCSLKVTDEHGAYNTYSFTVTHNETVDDYSDILFWWRCEGVNLDANLDHYGNDGTGDLISGATIHADAHYIGTNGLNCPTSNDYIEFTDANDTDCDPAEGSHSRWIKIDTWVDDSGIFYVYGDDDNKFWIVSSGTDNLKWIWKDGGTLRANWIIDDTGLSDGEWHFLELEWDTVANARRCIVDNVPIESDAGTIGDFAVAVTKIRYGEFNAVAGVPISRHDNIVTSNDVDRDHYLLRNATQYPGYAKIGSIGTTTQSGTYGISGSLSVPVMFVDGNGNPKAVTWTDAALPYGYLLTETGATDLRLYHSSPATGVAASTHWFSIHATDANYVNSMIVATMASADLTVSSIELEGGTFDADTSIPAGENLADNSAIVIDTDSSAFHANSPYWCQSDGTQITANTEITTPGYYYIAIESDDATNFLFNYGSLDNLYLTVRMLPADRLAYYFSGIGTSKLILRVYLYAGDRAITAEDTEVIVTTFTNGATKLVDAGGNEFDYTLNHTWLIDANTLTVNIPGVVTLGSGGDYPLWTNGSTGFHDLSYDIDTDKFNVLAAFTDDVAISADNVRIRGTGGNVAITGTMTLTGDNTIIKCLTFSGGITDNGNDYVYQENCRGQLVD